MNLIFMLYSGTCKIKLNVLHVHVQGELLIMESLTVPNKANYSHRLSRTQIFI